MTSFGFGEGINFGQFWSRIELVVRSGFWFLIAYLGLILGLRVLVFSPYRMASNSMLPQLRVGELILAYKLPFLINKWIQVDMSGESGAPSRGSVVIVQLPHTSFFSVRRVMGLEGDKVQLQDGKVILNDQVADHFPAKILLTAGAGLTLDPMMVPPGYVFVVSDNRVDEKDATRAMLIPQDHIIGYVFLLWWRRLALVG